MCCLVRLSAGRRSEIFPSPPPPPNFLISEVHIGTVYDLPWPQPPTPWRMVVQDAGTLFADGFLDDAYDDADDVASAYNFEYYYGAFLNTSFNAVEGDYTASVHLFGGSDAAWSLVVTISGEVVLFEEGDLTRSSPTSADFTVSWTDFDSTCWDELTEGFAR